MSKKKEVPAYQVAPTIKDLIEALMKADQGAQWTTDRMDNGYYSVTLYDPDGTITGMVVNKQ
jgi:hypothetical protein